MSSVDLEYNHGHDRRFNEWVDERIKHGVCQCDVWNLDNFILHILVKGLRDLAEITDGHPDAFESQDEWEAWLNEVADDFAQAIGLLDSIYQTDYDQAKEVIREAFAKLSEHFTDLWD